MAKKSIWKKLALVFGIASLAGAATFAGKKVIENNNIKQCQTLLKNKLLEDARDTLFLTDPADLKKTVAYDFTINENNDFVFDVKIINIQNRVFGRGEMTYDIADEKYETLTTAKESGTKTQYNEALYDVFETMELKKYEKINWWLDYSNDDIKYFDYFCNNISDENNQIKAVVFNEVLDAGTETIDGVSYAKAEFHCKAVVAGNGTVEITSDNSLGNLFGEQKKYENSQLKNMVVTLYVENALNKNEDGEERFGSNQGFCVSFFSVDEFFNSAKTAVVINESVDVNAVEEDIIEKFVKTFDCESGNNESASLTRTE